MIGRSKVIQSLIFITLFLFNYSFASDDSFNVVRFKKNNDSDWTRAFLRAWKYVCALDTKNVTIYVPRGTYLLRHVEFNGGKCKKKWIDFVIDGTLVAPADYNAIQNTYYWLLFKEVDGLTILGGTIDGQGTNLWDSKRSKNNNHPKGVASLGICSSKNVTIDGLISHDSQMFHIIVFDSENVDLNDISIIAPEDSPNTDGIHLQQSSRVNIWNSVIQTGDDCISMVKGTTDVWIENVECGPGHGISIGSLGRRKREDGVQNVTVKNATFIGTTNGLRIKAWSKNSTAFADKILFQDIVMHYVDNPIMITENYCPDDKCPHEGKSTVKINNIEFQNIRGVSRTETAVTIDCAGIYGCKNITLDDVYLSYNGSGHATAYCINADVHIVKVNRVEPMPQCSS